MADIFRGKCNLQCPALRLKSNRLFPSDLFSCSEQERWGEGQAWFLGQFSNGVGSFRGHLGHAPASAQNCVNLVAHFSLLVPCSIHKMPKTLTSVVSSRFLTKGRVSVSLPELSPCCLPHPPFVRHVARRLSYYLGHFSGQG